VVAVAVVPALAVTHLYQAHLAVQKWLHADLLADLLAELKQLRAIHAADQQLADHRAELRQLHAILAAVQLDADQHAEPKWLPVILVQVPLDQAVDAKLLRRSVPTSQSWVFSRE